ncbi:MAG: transglutaminase-like domain-containing protein, partial [Actinomycetota bacterium]|nr:transglutaminase-like domain-containing protein [Actinomycetota bacterium]
MDATEHFVALVRGPQDQLRLDQAALWLAAHAQPDLDVDIELARLDDIASACLAPTFDALHRLLFAEMGLSGDTDDYHDPANSFLNQVIDRRVGIPISLSVLVMEVGRRVGVELEGVGMPGHFLVRHPGPPVAVIDPFHRGRVMDVEDCAVLYRSVFGSGSSFSPSLLAAVSPRSILARMLANLQGCYAQRRDLAALVWVSRLRLAIPGLPAGELAGLSRL